MTVLGATSTSLPITSGVPQGSLLAPFLFSVYINDLPNNLTTSTGIGLYADDNLPKCKVLSVTRKKSPLVYPYKLGDHQLQFSDVEVDRPGYHHRFKAFMERSGEQSALQSQSNAAVS